VPTNNVHKYILHKHVNQAIIQANHRTTVDDNAYIITFTVMEMSHVI